MESSTETNFPLSDDVNNDQVLSSSNRNNLPVNNNLIPINKWSNQHVLEWLNKKMPQVYENHRDSFVENEITGEILLSASFNATCLRQLKIYDRDLIDQLMTEISLLKIMNECEFIKRFKSLPMTTKI